MTPKEKLEQANLERSQESYERALILYCEAEEDSEDGKYPEASIQKGDLYSNKLGDYKNAIIAYTKAENDSENGRLPFISYNKGRLFGDRLKDYENAINSYTKAEKDNVNGKFPDASFEKGQIYKNKLKDYENAIISYTKAENDSENGKHPMASLKKGEVYEEEYEDYENAMFSYTRAEEDSESRNFPAASFRKGLLFMKYKNYKKALISLTHAENNAKNKQPFASVNKGTIYNGLREYPAAIESFNKALKDIPYWGFIDAAEKTDLTTIALIGRSTSELKMGLHKEAEEDAFNAIKINNRSLRAVYHVLTHFSCENTNKIYKERLNYLEIHLSVMSLKADKSNSNFQVNRFLHDHDQKEINNFLFLCLETNVNIGKAIENIDRHRLAYLVAYKEKMYGNAFYILDELIDEKFQMSEMDQYFYLASAYLIGEPLEELKNYAQDPNSIKTKIKSNDLITLKRKINVAIDENKCLDSYLFDVTLNSFVPSNELKENNLDLHPWLIDVLESIINNKDYKVPLSKYELIGLLAEIFVNVRETYLTQEIRDMACWDVFDSTLKSKKYGKKLIDYCIKCIDEKVPVVLMLNELFALFSGSENEKDRHNLAIVQATLIVYSRGNDIVLKGISTETSKTILSTFMERGVSEALGGLLYFGFAIDCGVSLACSFILKITIRRINSRSLLNKVIEELKNEMLD